MRYATLFTLFFCANAHAGFIFDTGTPTNPSGSAFTSPSYLEGTPSEGTAQTKFAAALTITHADTTISDVEVFLSSLSTGPGGEVLPTGGDIVTSIYSDSAGSIGVPLFSDTFHIDAGDPGAWHGISGLSWALPPGNYWAVVDASGDPTYNGGLGTGVPKPSLQAWFTDIKGWTVGPGSHGWRISGDPVPEPSGIVLAISGLLCFVLSRTRCLLDSPG